MPKPVMETSRLSTVGIKVFFLRGELLKQVLESRLERCCVQRILKVHDGARDRSRRKAVDDASDKADDNGFRRCVIQGAVFAMIKEGEQLAEINIKQRIHDVIDERFRRQIRLNARAISQIRPGGILFTFSCSQAVSKELFRTMIFSAAAIAGRNVRILHQLTQPADHPVSIYHPEGEYLKGLVLYVE